MLRPKDYQILPLTLQTGMPSFILVPLRRNPILLLQLFQKYGKAAELYDTVARAARYEVWYITAEIA